MKELKNWAPEFLRSLYTLEVGKLKIYKLNPKQKAALSWKLNALYRLGTHEDMREVWHKLLAKDTFLKNSIHAEKALVGGIHQLVWLNSHGIKLTTPGEEKEKLEEISKKIRELQKLIKRVGVADFEEKVILETALHKRNMKYRAQKGEEINSEPLMFSKFINGNINAELSHLPLGEDVSWGNRSQSQRLGWWAREATRLTLIEVLNLYVERMGEYSIGYKEQYGQFQPKLIKGLKTLMKKLYGSSLEDYVGRIATVILEKEITRDYLRGYK